MKRAPVKAPATLPDDGLVSLESVLCTEELSKRPPRPPDYERENRALAALVKALADSPRSILQALADKILDVFNAGSAGVSLLAKEDGGKRFYWPAIAGAWKPHIGGGTPRHFSPCGDVLDRNAPLLFRHFERRYAYFLPVTPPVEECLLVPFYVEGDAVGTIWAIAHDEDRKFDAEDLRMLESLGRFASAAYQAVESLNLLQQRGDALREDRIDLAQRVADLQRANAEARESRRAALNLMEDAVLSRQAIEKLNGELRASEERYRILFDLGPVAVYSIDTSGLIENFNRRAAELWRRQPATGDTEERFCGSFKLFHPDGSIMPHEQCPMAEVVTGRVETVNDAEVVIERPDGSRVTVVVNIRPLKNTRGEITGAINCFYDITERKQAEEARKALNDQLAADLAGTQRLQETSTLLIHGGDVGALYQQILEAAIAIMHSDMSSLQMLNDERNELRLLGWRGFHPESAVFWERVRMESGSSCAAALRAGQRIIIPDLETSEVAAGTPDLTEYRRSNIRAVQSTPLVSRSGRLIGIISTHWRKPHQPAERDLRLIDVLARQAADLIERAQTEEARARLASIVESSDDAIISKDLNGIITSWNKGARRLFGYTAREAVGQSVTMLIPPDRLNEESAILERIRRGEAVEHYETVRRRKDGQLLDISLTISPIKNAEGQVVGASKIARDITDRKKAEQALRESQALLANRAIHLEQLVAERTARLQDTIAELEHFSYSITHDMRAPLRAMQGFGSMLQSDSGDRLTPKSADYLRRIVNAARRMDALIRDSLQYAKVVREKIPLAIVEPAPVLRGVLESYPNLQPPKVKIQVEEPLPRVIANEGGLAQCFSNLSVNAIKFVKAGQIPKIRVWAEGRGESVRFWFEDNGIGIPKEYQERIFGMFQQLDRSYEGTGIGLALVRKTAERMDGRVGVESEPGKGSRFWLEFKRADPPTQASANPP